MRNRTSLLHTVNFCSFPAEYFAHSQPHSFFHFSSVFYLCLFICTTCFLLMSRKFFYAPKYQDKFLLVKTYLAINLLIVLILSQSLRWHSNWALAYFVWQPVQNPDIYNDIKDTESGFCPEPRGIRQFFFFTSVRVRYTESLTIKTTFLLTVNVSSQFVIAGHGGQFHICITLKN